MDISWSALDKYLMLHLKAYSQVWDIFWQMNWKPFKNDEKDFLFHFKSSFRS